MQLVHTPQHTQLSLFEAFMAQPLAPILKETVEAPWGGEPEAFSELSLRGAAESCLNLLAPILRELSEDQDARWLTLIAPPASLTQAWLRAAGLTRERSQLPPPRGAPRAQHLTCDAWRLGRSHTVVSWLSPLNASAKQQLISAARTGDAQSLNIRLG